MKINELKTLNGKKKDEIMKDVKTKKIELANFISRMHAGKEKNLKKGKNLRKDIAQMLTSVGQIKGEK